MNTAADNALTFRMDQSDGAAHVFRGDLNFYNKDDGLIARLQMIDTAKTPVHFNVGADDMTCTPEDSNRTADQISGATLSVMDELGHFPMSEHPQGFLPFFLEALSAMQATREDAESGKQPKSSDVGHSLACIRWRGELHAADVSGTVNRGQAVSEAVKTSVVAVMNVQNESLDLAVDVESEKIGTLIAEECMAI